MNENPYFNVATKDIDDPEHTQTKEEWEKMQTRLDIINDTLTALTDEQLTERRFVMEGLSREATFAAIVQIIERHPVEFEELLYAEKISRGVHAESAVLNLFQ